MEVVGPIPPQIVAHAFVKQYYEMLYQTPSLVHRFYQNISKIGRPSDDGTMIITSSMEAIKEKILSLNYDEIRPEIKTVDAHESLNGGVHILVTGCHVMNDNLTRNFSQSFLLAPQQNGGYFVFSDIFRYTWDINHATEINVSPNNEKATSTPSEGSSPSEIEKIDVPINNKDISVEAVENGEVEAVENGEVVVVEVVPVAEVVVVEVPDESKEKVESVTKDMDVPKKSYASIVKIMRERKAPISAPPPAAPRGNTPKVQEKPVNLVQASVSATEVPLSGPDATENGSEGDICSIFLKGLSFNATPALIQEECKKFGSIKSGGIQIRSNKTGFCFGFVEFEISTSVEKALKASPMMIGGREVIIERKQSPYNSRLNNNRIGRFQGGRGGGGLGFRNEGPRVGGGGRGNYGGGAGGRTGGYSRGGDFNGRSEFVNRGVNNGNRAAAGMGINGPAAKATAPRVSATA